MADRINEHDMVVLLRDLPEQSLVAGDIGCAVFVHGDGEAFEVEFDHPAGTPRDLVVTINAGDLLKLRNVERLAG